MFVCLSVHMSVHSLLVLNLTTLEKSLSHPLNKLIKHKYLYNYRIINLPTLLSGSQSRVRTTLLWFSLQFCRFYMCTIQEQSRGKSFLERFLKKIDFSSTGKVVVMQILVNCIDSFFDSILLFYAKFPFI